MNRSLRQAILERDNYTCRYCGERPDPTHYWHSMAGRYGRWMALIHVDHVIPKSKGGTDDPDNLVAACQACNLVKYDNVWDVP
jgi:5-methylcytosine-specific restriction endonuclease McrA